MTQSQVLDQKTFAIGVLSITACVRFVGFLLGTLTPQPATAANMNDRAGDYIMVTQQLSSSREAVLVMDTASKQMLSYILDMTGPQRQLVLLERVSFDLLEEQRQGRRR